MRTLLRYRLVLVFLLAVTPILASLRASAQDPATKRRLLNNTAPAYPALARNLALAGVVKADVLVAPDGSVKSVDVRGGHPVLAQAALNAVRRWKWEAAVHESREYVEVKFTPPE